MRNFSKVVAKTKLDKVKETNCVLKLDLDTRNHIADHLNSLIISK